MMVERYSPITLQSTLVEMGEDKVETIPSTPLVQQYCDQASIHGIFYVGGTGNHLLRRILWVVPIAVSIVMAVIIVKPQIESFFHHEVITSISAETIRNGTRFPAITICNVNFLRRSIVSRSPNLVARLGEAKDGGGSVAAKACSSRPTDLAIEGLDALMNTPELFQKTYKTYSRTLVKHINIQVIYLNSAEALISMDSHQSVMSCVLFGRTYNQTCALKFRNFNADVGHCFTFNADSELQSKSFNDLTVTSYPPITEPVRNMISGGPISGVTMVLNTHQHDYCDAGFFMDAGFRLSIHDPSQIPMFSLDNSIALAPGYMNDIVVSTRQYRRNTAGFGKCTYNYDLNYPMPRLKHTEAVCYLDCLSKHIFDTCGCLQMYAPGSAIGIEMARNASYGFDNITCVSVKSVACQTKVQSSYLTGDVKERYCPHCQKSPCKETVFDMKTSMQSFPASNYFDMFKGMKHPDLSYMETYYKPLDAKLPNFTTYLKLTNAKRGDFVNLQEARENLLGVKLYLRNMNVEVITENPALTIECLVSQFGGALGLFLGASVLSIVEILYWALIGFYTFCFK